jgi:hypothetical protein
MSCQHSSWTAWPFKMGMTGCPQMSVSNCQPTFCNIQHSKDHTWKTVFQVIIIWVIWPYRIINLLRFWGMCCVHVQTDCIWFRWKLNWMGAGNESILQGGYKDGCGCELHKGKRREILSHTSSVKQLFWQSFYIFNPSPSVSAWNKFSHPEDGHSVFLRKTEPTLQSCKE